MPFSLDTQCRATVKAQTRYQLKKYRGAKTAMTVALRSPNLLSSLVSVDNAPIDATLNGDFSNYVQGMKMVEGAAPKKQVEADSVLINYEKVGKASPM